MNEISISVCPRCQNRFVRMPNTGDFEHTCHGQEVLKNESVLKIGDWTDFTGSDLNVNNALMQGTENKLFGTRAQIEGAKEQTRDSRGYPTDRFRSRQHIHSIPKSQFEKEVVISSDDPEVYE